MAASPLRLPLACLLLCLPAFAQTDSGVTVSGAVRQPLTLSVADLAKLPHITIHAKEHGADVTYSGVPVYSLLEKAGAPVGKELSGKALATYVLATAQDGYQAVFSITDFDPAFTDVQVIVADQADGKPLASTQGPLRIVAPQDKKPARSLRMLQKLEVVRLRP